MNANNSCKNRITTGSTYPKAAVQWLNLSALLFRQAGQAFPKRRDKLHFNQSLYLANPPAGGLLNYLLRVAVQPYSEALVDAPPKKNLGIVVVIPCYNEPNLISTLHSLYSCYSTDCSVEVIVIVNSGENEAEQVLNQNAQTLEDANEWIAQHKRAGIDFFIIHQTALPKKIAGVGLARKIGMDEAVRRLQSVGNEKGIIACFDADATCAENYLVALEKLFTENQQYNACSIYFEHPLSGTEYPSEIYEAIISYELFLRYYLQALRYAGHPFSFHTIGSSMAVRAAVYAKQGGMNKRKAGEDFYFLQKIIPLGNYIELNTSTVFPSPRSSDRVPFGTGMAVSKILENKKEEYRTYAPQTFNDLKVFLKAVPSLYRKYDITQLPSTVVEFLNTLDFAEKWEELKANTTTEESFIKRFYQWFDGFKVLKFVHFSRDHFYPQQSVFEAAAKLLLALGLDDESVATEKDLLIRYRDLEIKNPHFLSEDFQLK